jgi:hypothetical protein
MSSKTGYVAVMLAVAFLGVGTGADAATITATNCSLPSMQLAVNAARGGNIVKIPDGSCTWSSPVTIVNKAITL